MNLTNSREIQLGEETNWNCCVCWWRGERGRVDRRGKEDRPPLLHPTPPNSTQRHPTPARLWWSLRPCQRVKQRLLARNLFSASATPRQPVSPRQPSGPQHGAGTWHLAPGQPSGPNVGLARSRRTDHALTTQPTQGECRTGANCFFLEATRGRSRSVRLAQ